MTTFTIIGTRCLRMHAITVLKANHADYSKRKCWYFRNIVEIQYHFDFTFTFASKVSVLLILASGWWSFIWKSLGDKVAGAKNLRKRNPLIPTYLWSWKESKFIRECISLKLLNILSLLKMINSHYYDSNNSDHFHDTGIVRCKIPCRELE